MMIDTRARGCGVCLDPDELVTGEVHGLPACEGCCEADRHVAVSSDAASERRGSAHAGSAMVAP